MRLPFSAMPQGMHPTAPVTALAIAMLCGHIAAHAQIQANGSTATTVATQPGGHQVITPARPKGDVSYNAFSRFDVGAAGASFANRDVNARTIVAEVFSPLPSRIEGPVSVDGPRANLILANQNGLRVNGGSFVNFGSLALTTGIVTLRDVELAPGAVQRYVDVSTRGGLSPGLSGSLTIYGKNSTNQRGTENVDDASTSLISATGGNAILRAGTDEQYKGTGEGNVTVQGADLLAKERVSASGNAVHLEAVDNTRDTTYHMDSKSLTLGARPAGVLGGLVNTVTDAINNQSNGASDRLAAASALKAGYDVYKFVDSGKAAAVMDTIGEGSKDPTQAGIGVSISINSSKSSQDSESHSNHQRGTNAQSANLDITANEGDITMGGAKLQAENIALDAAKDIKLTSALWRLRRLKRGNDDPITVRIGSCYFA